MKREDAINISEIAIQDYTEKISNVMTYVKDFCCKDITNTESFFGLLQDKINEYNNLVIMLEKAKAQRDAIKTVTEV